MITKIKHFLLQENISQMRQFLKSIDKEKMEDEFNFIKDKFTKTPNLIYPFVKMMFDKDNEPHINKDEFELVSNWILKNKHLIKELPKNIQNYNSLEELQDDIRKVDLRNAYKSFYNSLYRNMKNQIDELEGEKLDNFIFLINKFLELPEDKRKEFPPLKYFEANNLPLGDLTDAIINFLENGEVNSSKESVLRYIEDKNLDIRYNENNILVFQSNDRDVITKLGSPNWCIVYAQDIYFSKYIGDDVLGTQYIVYNFNLPISSNSSQYGISIKIDGSPFAGGCQDKGNIAHNLDSICDELNIDRKTIFTTNYKDIYNKIEKAKEITSTDNETDLVNNILSITDPIILTIIFKGMQQVGVQALIKTNPTILIQLLKNAKSLNKEFVNVICGLPNVMYYLSSDKDSLDNIGDFLIKVDNLLTCSRFISDINRNQKISYLIPIKNQFVKYLDHLIELNTPQDDINDIKRVINQQLCDIYIHTRGDVDNIQEIEDIYTLLYSDEYIMENIVENSDSENIYDLILQEYPISEFINSKSDIIPTDITQILDICRKSTIGFNYDTLDYIIELDIDSNANRESCVTIIHKIFEEIPTEELDDDINKLSEAWLLLIYLYTKNDDKLKDKFTKKLYEKLKLDENGYAEVNITEYSDFEDYFDRGIDFMDTYSYFDWEIDDDDWSNCIDDMDVGTMLVLAKALHNEKILTTHKETILKYDNPTYLESFKDKSFRVIFSDEQYSDIRDLHTDILELFNDTPGEYEDGIESFKYNLSRGYNRAVSQSSEESWFREVDKELLTIFEPWEDGGIVDWNRNMARYNPISKVTIDEDLIDALIQEHGEEFNAEDLLDVFLSENGKLTVPDTNYESPDGKTINEHTIVVLYDEYKIDFKIEESVILKFKDFIIKKD